MSTRNGICSGCQAQHLEGLVQQRLPDNERLAAALQSTFLENQATIIETFLAELIPPTQMV